MPGENQHEGANTEYIITSQQVYDAVNEFHPYVKVLLSQNFIHVLDKCTKAVRDRQRLHQDNNQFHSHPRDSIHFPCPWFL